MQHRFRLIGVLAITTILANAHALTSVGARPPAPPTDPGGLVAHEWGTFTSVADEQGLPVQWMPQAGPVDLPCFVHNVRYDGKAGLWGTVRMETPVIYFYSPKPTSVDVRVRFNRGIVTEWYPEATVTPANVSSTMLSKPAFESSIEWKGVKVMPGVREDFPTDGSKNHYYAARETDAAPLQVGTEQEKLLFYRGVGNFPPPLAATIDADRRVSVRDVDGGLIGDVMLFENRGGTSAFSARRMAATSGTIDPLPRVGASASPRQALIDLLVSHGLYPREATAMVDTWRDSWFEEGTRLFYVLSPAAVDRILPLDISPAPDKIARVFVGRMELVTDEMVDGLKAALDARDRKALASYGRFLGPIVQRLRARTPAAERPALDKSLSFAYTALLPTPRSCP